jgi:hypothetical protein
MSITSTTSLTEIVASESISQAIMAYQLDQAVIAQFARYEDISGLGTKTKAFPRWVKDATEDITTEAVTTFTAVELETTEATVTVAQLGILREMTKLVMRTNILGEDSLRNFIAEDGAKLCMEATEDDLFAHLPSISLSVGSSGNDFTLVQFLEGLAKRRIAKANGAVAFVGHPQQIHDLMADMADSSGTPYSSISNQGILQMAANNNGFAGNLFGCDLWYSNLAKTANAGADVVGGYVNHNGTTLPESTLALVELWKPEVESQSAIESLTYKWSINKAHGTGLINDAMSVKAVTDAP